MTLIVRTGVFGQERTFGEAYDLASRFTEKKPGLKVIAIIK